MLLFLDTVSPLPEFSIIEDNKIIYSKEILVNNEEKLSDCILSSYIEIEKKFSLNLHLKLMIIVTGPGSYTALRVGIAFLSGISIAKKIRLIGIPCLDLFQFSINRKDPISSIIFIHSSNNQKFICLYNEKSKLYSINKLEKNNMNDLLMHLSFKRIYTNSIYSLDELDYIQNTEIIKLRFSDLVKTNLKKIISLRDKEIIEPIYISNNKILN